MIGERMNQIYATVCLGQKPKLKDDEERAFYKKLIKEMQTEAKKDEKPIAWVIPSE